jgi:hypothetical protein
MLSVCYANMLALLPMRHLFLGRVSSAKHPPISPQRKPRSQMQHQAQSFTGLKRVLDNEESDCDTALKMVERRKQ